MLTAAVVVSYGLGRGFERAVTASDLPDVIVRFNPEARAKIAQRIAALPDLAGFSLRREVGGVGVEYGARGSPSASVEVVGRGRRGYAVLAGRDLSTRAGEVLVERGLAVAWGIPLGGTLNIDGLGRQHIVGFTESPDNVSYPLAVPRVYISLAGLEARFGAGLDQRVNLAQIWLRDPRNLDAVLVQARATSYGIHGLRFVTQTGVRVLLDQAAGIVIDLLVALSVIALVSAAVMLAASARAEVQRRLQGIGVRRAVGAPRGHLAATHALEALVLAVPAATIGAVAGTLATYSPTGRLLTLLNEPAPGASLIVPLLATWLVAVAIPVLAAAWPAWRAAGRPVGGLLAGAELAKKATGPLAGGSRAGLVVLGARLAGARRVRLLATGTVLGFSTAFILLMLALASALSTLETDPGALGKRYQLTAALPPSAVARVRQIPGVQAVAPRYEVQAVDSFSLQETIDVIAYPGDPTAFEAPPLLSGGRIRSPREAEVGAGLADALGLVPGSTLAIQLPTGTELRLRVSGIVGSFDHDGRVAYVPAVALLGADPSAPEALAVQVRPGADVSAVSAALGPGAVPASGAVARGVPLVNTLRTILRAVAIVDGLVCLYALIQSCALTVHERRRTISVLRAIGADGPAIGRLLAGAVLALVIPAAALGVVLERVVLGPILAHLAAGYATLSLTAGTPEIAAVLAGLALAGLVAVVWVAMRATRGAVISGRAT
ncbi:MAG: FtsX-like permease family protein [Actinomycetota bacterium]|nr:FtsX-like permease family protein [Actinomycetota bacterium]